MDVKIKSNVNTVLYFYRLIDDIGRTWPNVYTELTDKVVTKVNINPLTAALRDHINER